MPESKKLIIAIDGYSSCGKSTFAKLIAQELGYIYIDTGAMYRAVTLFALRNKFISETEFNSAVLIELLAEVNIRFVKNVSTGKNDTFLNDEDVENEIRGMEISKYVSQISQLKSVRNKMVNLQRSMSEEKGVVMDGRDIGTVVFPNADIKIFMTADPDVRAHRRYDELLAKGEKVTLEEIRENLLSRDKQDTSRKESPLKQAADAYVLDNSNMTIEEQMDWFMKLLKAKMNNTEEDT
jgi:cytidylate kinase